MSTVGTTGFQACLSNLNREREAMKQEAPRPLGGSSSQSMMKSLVATRGYIEKVEGGQQKIDADYFVKSEKEAGREVS